MKELSSSDVVRELRRVMTPVLKRGGFTKFKGRTAYRYHEDFTVAFSSKAVGTYFGQVTGYTPMSFDATIWINYHAIPERSETRQDRDGLLLPTTMHRHLTLAPVNLQLQARTGVRDGPELERKDLWWLSRSGDNLKAVIGDVATAYEQQVPRWCETYTDIPKALAEVDQERDCFNKYEFMYCLASSIGHETYIKKYKALYFEKMPKFVKDKLNDKIVA